MSSLLVNGVALVPGYNGVGSVPNNVNVGDSWTLTLTGGTPNAPIYLGATWWCTPDQFQLPNCITNKSMSVPPYAGQIDVQISTLLGRSQSSSAPIGNYDGNGNFTISGVFGPNTVGTWMLAGYAFRVNDPSASASPTPTFQAGVANWQLTSPHIPANPNQYTPQVLAQMASVNKVTGDAVAQAGTSPSQVTNKLPDLTQVGASLTSNLTQATGLSLGTLGLIAGGLVVAFLMFGRK